MRKNFKDLDEREILALAVSLEEEDGRIYGEFVEGLRETYPPRRLFEDMQAEEAWHRHALIELYGQLCG
jgi:rubrerythrin